MTCATAAVAFSTRDRCGQATIENHGFEHTLEITVPPLTGVFLAPA